MSGYVDLSLGEGDENFGRKSDKFKGVAGQTERLTLAWMKTTPDGLPTGKPIFKGARRHFLSGVGYFLANGPEFTKIAGKDAKEVAATIVVKWPSRNGDLDKSRLLDGWQVMPWVFSGDKYSAIRGIHQEFPLELHDLKVTCTDSQFQKMTFSPCKDNVLAKLAESEKGAIVAKEIMAAVAHVATQIESMLGTNMSLTQIRERLAGGGGGGGGGGIPHQGAAPVDSSVNDADLDDLLA